MTLRILGGHWLCFLYNQLCHAYVRTFKFLCKQLAVTKYGIKPVQKKCLFYFYVLKVFFVLRYTVWHKELLKFEEEVLHFYFHITFVQNVGKSRFLAKFEVFCFIRSFFWWQRSFFCDFNNPAYMFVLLSTYHMYVYFIGLQTHAFSQHRISLPDIATTVSQTLPLQKSFNMGMCVCM